MKFFIFFKSKSVVVHVTPEPALFNSIRPSLTASRSIIDNFFIALGSLRRGKLARESSFVVNISIHRILYFHVRQRDEWACLYSRRPADLTGDPKWLAKNFLLPTPLLLTLAPLIMPSNFFPVLLPP